MFLLLPWHFSQGELSKKNILTQNITGWAKNKFSKVIYLYSPAVSIINEKKKFLFLRIIYLLLPDLFFKTTYL